jgi:hypothetical protein
VIEMTGDRARNLQAAQRIEQLPPDRFPNMVALAGPLTSTADRFEFGLDVIVRGLASRASDS